MLLRSTSLIFFVVMLASCTDKTPPSWGDGEIRVETTEDSFTLHWPMPADDTAVTKIQLRRDGQLVAELGGDATSYTLENLSDSEDIRVEVVARDENGNGSAPLFAVGRTADATPPSWPAAALIVHEEGRLYWNPARDAIGVTGYVVRAGTNIIGTTGERDLDFDGKPEGVSVIAKDAAGNESAPLVYRATSGDEIAAATTEAETEIAAATNAETTQPSESTSHMFTLPSAAITMIAAERIRPINLDGVRGSATIRDRVLDSSMSVIRPELYRHIQEGFE